MKIAVQESVVVIFEELFFKTLEVILQPAFVELQPGGLQEAVFEVVKVKIHHAGIKLLLGIADAPVKPLGPFELQLRELFDGPAEKIALIRVVETAFASLRYEVKEHFLAKILLYVGQAVFRYSEHCGYIYALLLEVLGQGYEGAVFFQAGAEDSDDGNVAALEPEVSAVAAGCGKFGPLGQLLARVAFEQSFECIFCHFIVSCFYGSRSTFRQT